ncbi:MAG: hypothetical protein CMF99_00760 [Candidatus Marinimicrobia bacterium]|nr:hypothetical protein [Candidatus Neomarinimicrobiota bacterium]
MRRYIVLLLITGTVWAQTGLDKLVLKNGTEYLGEYSRKDFKLYTYNLDYIDQEVIYFKPLEAFAFQPVTVDAIKVLQLRDGTLLYNTEGKITEKKLFWTFVIALFGIFLYSSHSNSSSGSGGGGKVFLGDGPPI